MWIWLGMFIACGDKEQDSGAVETDTNVEDTEDSGQTTDTNDGNVDNDGDGFLAEDDCNDDNPDIFPYDRSEFGGGVGCGWYVEAGVDFTCGLSSAGTVTCWGADDDMVNNVPRGTFVQLSVGTSHACVRDSLDAVACWGNDLYQQATPPSDAFVDVTAGGYQTCGLRADGTADCWGGYNSGTTPAVEGTFSSISSGAYHNCGLTTDGVVRCWAPEGIDVPENMPEEEFVQIVAGTTYTTCGLTSTGTAMCWGDRGDAIGVIASDVASLQNGAASLVCLQRTDGTGSCVGIPGDAPELISEIPTDLVLSNLNAGLNHACATTERGNIQCWGDEAAYPVN